MKLYEITTALFLVFFLLMGAKATEQALKLEACKAPDITEAITTEQIQDKEVATLEGA